MISVPRTSLTPGFIEVDENLSRKPVVRLAELYAEAAHVAEAGLLEGPVGVTLNELRAEIAGACC